MDRSLSTLVAVTATLACSLGLGLPLGHAEPEPTVEASADGTLSLRAGLSHGYLPVDDSRHIHSRLRVRAGEATTSDRPPLNLAVVIDRSGSMRGGRLAHAKQAAHSLVKRLSEKDRLAIVAYGSEVTVHADSRPVTPARSDELNGAISAIDRNGSTLLSGGFEQGNAIVAEHATDASVDRVLLLSDGKANRGKKTVGALGNLARQSLRAGVSITTIGIGLDYDEDIMTTMAEMGAGHHHFVEDDSQLTEIFGREFETLANVVARDARLVVRLGPGVEILDLHGFSHDRQDGRIVVNLDSFYARQHKDLLMDLAVSPSEAGSLPILEARLAFDDDTGERDREVHSSAAVTAVATPDSTHHDETNESVMRRVEQITYAESVERASDAFEQGERERARDLIERQRRRLRDKGTERGISREKVREKSAELDELEADMDRSGSPESASGKRIQKETQDETLELFKSNKAF